MPQKTQIYKLDYFKQGSYYSALSDYRRFVTLDYNLNSYIGFCGAGVIQGWNIEVVSGLTIKILPGTGIINGFFVESPYTVKQRSDMIDGDREIEVLNEDDIPEAPLTISQRTEYIRVVKLYDPSFNPPVVIENSYVKVVVPYEITLPNNSDGYLYAKLLSNNPYPPLNDYPPPAGNPPNRADYSDYDSYQVAMSVYNAKLIAIHNYEWYTDSANHFTEVEFVTSGRLTTSTSQVFIGKVTTRNGGIFKIDTSAVDILANFESLIRQFASDFLVTHHHGGSRTYDPPKVRLETDRRETSLLNYYESNGRTVYQILSPSPTSITLGHKHTYTVDNDGNGLTIGQTGSTNSHFHKITTYVVGNNEPTIATVETHTHTLPDTSVFGFDASTRFVVYKNGVLFGDNTTPYIHVNPTKQTVTFDKGISASKSTYSVSFSTTYINSYSLIPQYVPDPNLPGDTGEIFDPNLVGKSETISYSYTGSAVSVYLFMLRMIADYNNANSKYTDSITVYDYTDQSGSSTRTAITNSGYVLTNLASNPFYFLDLVSGTVASLKDLIAQSQAAQLMLKNIGNEFTFTPNAASNVTVTIKVVGHVDDIQIEFLSNTEVTGKLRPESIVYFNASKILTGEFKPEVLPLISHIGRLKEECLPLQYDVLSQDGIRFEVVPTITDINWEHRHKLYVNTDINGSTSNLLVGNATVYYQDDQKGNTHYIYHNHGVSNGTVTSGGSDGLLQWQNNVNSTNLSSSDHIHNVVYPVIGNEKTIYSIKEDINGNIYTGTSDGFMMIPSSPAYQFVINGLDFYFYGNDLWNLLILAAGQYQVETGTPVAITTEIYGDQLAKASLVNVGDSVLMYGTPFPNRQTDQIMIKKISSFKIPNFRYRTIKNIKDVLPNEIIIETYTNTVTSITGTETVTTALVERNFNNIPIWSIELDTTINEGQTYVSSTTSTDVIVAGSNLVAKNIGLNDNLYQPWSPIDLPFSVNVLRKVIKDASGNYWASSNSGVLVSRYYSSGSTYELTPMPGGNPDVKDILQGERDVIYCASSSGILKTINYGKTWDSLLSGSFRQIARDRTLDKSTVINGHYHNVDVDHIGNGFLGESIGAGTKHVHSITNWTVADTMGHTHTIIVTLYAIDNDAIIWKSTDNGLNWTQYGYLPNGECSDVFAAFGCLFVSQSNGLYKSNNGSSWGSVISSKIYSFEWSYDMSELYMGSDNILYGTPDGTTFNSIYEFSGNPSSILIENSIPKYFGYAYSNESQTFHLKDLFLDVNNISALVDFDIWYATNGQWSTSYPYDIYVNYKRVLSTKYHQDKRNSYGYHFEVIPSDGAVDFSASTSLAKQIEIYDDTIQVNNSSGFFTGDEIIIMSNSSSMHSTIVNISGDDLIIDSPSSQIMILPSSVKRIPSLNGSSNMFVNIYGSLLTNVGSLTHDQDEDGLSNYSDGRPFKLNDTYLSNLLQLTQAVRYVYPDINSEFINSMFYDFRYSTDPLDPYYINKYIDLLTSDSYNQKSYDSNFIGKGAKSINKILVGFGNFSGNIIVATDIGIFIAKIVTGFEANWVYVNALPYAVYDLMIFGSNKLYAATSNGTYNTEDLQTWTLEDSPAVSYPSCSLGLRWFDQTAVIAPAHDAQFTADSLNDLGLIVASSGKPYQGMLVNNIVNISDAGEFNGNYNIESVQNGGSTMYVSPSFTTSGSKSGVVISMGSWWGQWNGDVNVANPNITNTLLLGGTNNISFNDGTDAWYGAIYEGISSFTPRQFLALSNGRLLLAATGTSDFAQNNYLLKSDDIGQNWQTFKLFKEVKGTIVSNGVTDFNNTILTVSYANLNDYIYVNGIFDQHDIGIFVPGSTIALFRGKVVWNERKNGLNTITVFGNDLMPIILGKSNYNFVVYPIKVNTMIQSDTNTLFFGTNVGLYYDANTIVNNVYPQGTIVNVAYNAIVTKIDISGSIISLTINTATNNTVLSVRTDTVVRKNDIIGKYLYVTDTNPVEKYKIVENSSLAPGQEFVIQIVVDKALSNAYIGKNFRIVGDKSRVYTDFDLPVSSDQFSNGNAYISSNDTYSNFGTKYAISSNSTNYVDLSVPLIPSSTIASFDPTPIETPNALLSSVTAYSLQVGQSIRLIDSTQKLPLFISMDRSVKENSLKDFVFNNSSNAASSVVYSNFNNEITLSTSDIFDFSQGDSFVVKGASFIQRGGFSHMKTSTDSDHYHNANTVNNVISGSILYFSNNNASFVDIEVTDTKNFNIPLVQYNGDLLQGAQITFTNPQSISLRYDSEVVSHTSTSIKVRITSSSYWDFSTYNPLKISYGWQWQIDATNYGYTEGIIYNDFVVSSNGITETATQGSIQLKVESTVGINTGDKIRIQDDTLSYEINKVATIVDLTTIQTDVKLGRTWFIQRNPQMQVLRDSFANTHIHQIRDNEVQPILITEYLDNGYPSQHSHRVLPLISDVSMLINKNNNITSFGSSSIIYDSNDNGTTWTEVVDLNNYTEGSEEVSGISTASMYNGGFVVGATNGNIFVQDGDKNVEIIIPLNSP